MLEQVTSSQLTDMLAYYYLESGQYKKNVDRKAAPKRLKASLGHLVKNPKG